MKKIMNITLGRLTRCAALGAAALALFAFTPGAQAGDASTFGDHNGLRHRTYHLSHGHHHHHHHQRHHRHHHRASGHSSHLGGGTFVSWNEPYSFNHHYRASDLGDRFRHRRSSIRHRLNHSRGSSLSHSHQRLRSRFDNYRSFDRSRYSYHHSNHRSHRHHSPTFRGTWRHGRCVSR